MSSRKISFHRKESVLFRYSDVILPDCAFKDIPGKKKQKKIIFFEKPICVWLIVCYRTDKNNKSGGLKHENVRTCHDSCRR